MGSTTRTSYLQELPASLPFRTGKNKSVVLWSIHDHISTLAVDPGSAKSPGSGSPGIKHRRRTGSGGSGGDSPGSSPTIGPRVTYQGHEDTVEDVQFCPTSAQDFCGVGDDFLPNTMGCKNRVKSSPQGIKS